MKSKMITNTKAMDDLSLKLGSVDEEE